MCGRLTQLVSSATAFLAPDTAALLASATAAALAAGVTASGVDALSCATFACPAFALRPTADGVVFEHLLLLSQWLDLRRRRLR